MYFLILVGGIVRSTGSGMGCPDWPKCFGKWVPPTDVSQLPDNYKDIYASKRQGKNLRFASYLNKMGFEETASRIVNDESILEEADFNAQKTWTEYINRLIGAIIGLLILMTALYAFKFVKTDRRITFLAVAALILVIFQGWIGSIVVSTNLLPWMVTFHMLLAMLIVAVLIWLYHIAKEKVSGRYEPFTGRSGLVYTLIFCMLLMVVQITLGTQVRESVDRVAVMLEHSFRDQWIGRLGMDFLVHRSFSILILVVHAFLIYQIFRKGKLLWLPKVLVAVVILAIGSGAGMAYFDIPPFLQPIHLLLATLSFGLQFLLFLQLTEKPKAVTTVL